jgi:hypothetical protein
VPNEKRLRAAIDEAPRIQYRTNGDHHTCVLGVLALRAGVPLSAVNTFVEDLLHCSHESVHVLQRHYGDVRLSELLQAELVHAGCQYRSEDAQRAALHHWVDGLVARRPARGPSWWRWIKRTMSWGT